MSEGRKPGRDIPPGGDAAAQDGATVLDILLDGPVSPEHRPREDGSEPGRTLRPAWPMPAGARSGREPATRHVLVVEDDAPVRELTVRTVQALGYAVRAARGGPEALQMLSADLRCDLLLTDVVMPGMSGGQLARAARMLLPDLPVVFVTGHNADPLVEQLRRDGGAVLLAKPFRRRALAAALAQALFRG
jgi:CheY-like chemotaxis protein